MRELSDKFIPIIEEKIQARIADISNKVRVKVVGVKDPSETFSIRDLLQQIPWVSGVEEASMDEFQVSFPDNPIYLANSLIRKGFKIISYSRDAIRVRKPQN